MSEKDVERLEALLQDIRARMERLEERLKPEPTCLTYPEAAKRLGFGLTKLKQMVKSGEIKTAPIGRVPMIPLAEIYLISTPPPERPKVQRSTRAKAWVPIPKGKPKKR